jgi:hypothetical protein
MNESTPKWLRAALNFEKDLEQSGYYRKKIVNHETRNLVWLVIGISALFALVMFSHDRTKKVPVQPAKTISHDYPLTQRDIDFTKAVERSWKDIAGKP